MLSANYTIYLVLALTQRSIGHASVTKDEAACPAGCCTEPRGQSTRPKVCFDLFAPCLVPKIKIPNFFSAPAWRLKSRRNKKRIAIAACKSRDESNEPK